MQHPFPREDSSADAGDLGDDDLAAATAQVLHGTSHASGAAVPHAIADAGASLAAMAPLRRVGGQGRWQELCYPCQHDEALQCMPPLRHHSLIPD